MMTRLAVVFLVLGASSAFAEVGKANRIESRGQALVERMCASCHAVGKSGESPHIGAPALRNLDRQLNLDSFGERLREGLMSGHRDMPAFRFAREDARAVMVYLRSIQAP
jgi:mono/diheme cytochrome c family protein